MSSRIDEEGTTSPCDGEKRTGFRGAPLLAALLLCSSGCVSIGSTRIEHPFTTPCEPDQRISGVWKGRDVTQFGSGRFRMEFACDCTFEHRIQTMPLRFEVEGFYRIDDGFIVTEVFIDEGLGRWVRREDQFRVDAETLVFLDGEDPLVESEPRLRRVEQFECDSPGRR